jgi:hypothetical protein
MKKPPNDGWFLKRIFMDEVAKVLFVVLEVLRLTIGLIKVLRKLI